MADNLTTATIDVRANTRGLEKDILKALQTVELSQINTKKSSQALGRITGQVSEFNKSLEASNARVIAFGASAGAIFAVEKALSSLITSTIEVEKKLTDINVLLGLSSTNLEKFGNSLFNIARNTAQSFSEVADAATELSRQGLGVEETLKRTNAALILTRLSGLDAKSSVEALTATLNSFSGSALDAVEVVNKLANVDAAFAVSSADLANAISRVGSTAVDAGVSLDELIALVTSAQQTTARGGAVIGNSFKTIFTRLQRGKVQDLLGSLGVDTSEGQSAISLLQQLATTYDQLGSVQKSYIAEQVGGVFQINILKAALSDLGKEYSIYGRALDTSLSSTDQAIQRNELLNQTVAALSSQAVSNLEQAASKIGSIVFEPNAKGFLKGFNELLSSFNNIDAESAGGKLMTGFFKGIGDFIGGPGAVLATAVLVKLFARLTQFAAGSAKELLGTNKAAQQQAAIEQSILGILQKNSQFTSQILTGKITTVQAEKQMLDYLTAQSNILREQERLSKVIGANLTSAGVKIGASGIPMVAATKGKKVAASGFVPNFATDMAVGQAMENAGAKQHGYKAGKAKKTTIHDGNGKSFKSFVNNKEDVKTFTNAAGKKATIVRPPNGFGENTQYAAGGFVPNFAKEKYNISGGLVKTSQASNVADRGIDKYNSFSYEVLRVGNAKAFDREFNRHVANISSGDQDARDYFKRNGVPNSQIEQLEKNAKIAMMGGAPTKKPVKSLVDNREVNFDKQISSLRNNVIGKSRYEKYAASRTGLSRSSKSNERLDLVDSEGKPAGEVKFGEISKDNLLSKAIEVTASQDSKLKKQGRKNYIGKGAENIGIKSGLKLVVPNDSEISKKALGSSSGFVPNFASSSASWRANPQKGVAGESKTSINLKEREKGGKLKEVSHASQEDKFAPFDFKAKLPGGEELLIDSKNFKNFSQSKYVGEVSKKLWNYNQFDDLQKQTLDYTKTPVEIYIPKETYEKSRSLKGLKRNKIFQKPLNSLKGSGIKKHGAEDNLKFKSSIKTFAGGFVPNFATAKASDKMTEMVMQRFYGITDPKKFKEQYDIQSFKPAALKALYRERVGGGDSTLAGRAGLANQKTASAGDIPVKDLGKLDDYTMIHAGAEGYSKKIADYTKEDKKTGQKTRYLASIGTAGLNGKQLKGGSVQDRVGDALVTEANNLSETFNPGGGSKFSNYKQLANTGSVFSAAGTVFESAVRGAFNVPAQGQGDRIDFPNPSDRLRSFFHGAGGSYEAKITDNPQNRSSSLSKYVAVKGLSSGFIPNFVKSGLSFSHKDKDEFGFSEIQAIMSGKKVGSFSYAEDKKGEIDVGDFLVNKSERGKGIGSELYKEAIRRNAGKKMRGQLLPQMNRLLQKIKNGEPVSAETLYPQIKRADLAKSSVFEVYGHKGMTVEKMTRDQFSSFVNAKINELKKDPKKLQSFFGNVEADEYGGLGVDLQTQHASGFVPNFASNILKEKTSGGMGGTNYINKLGDSLNTSIRQSQEGQKYIGIENVKRAGMLMNGELTPKNKKSGVRSLYGNLFSDAKRSNMPVFSGRIINQAAAKGKSGKTISDNASNLDKMFYAFPQLKSRIDAEKKFKMPTAGTLTALSAPGVDNPVKFFKFKNINELISHVSSLPKIPSSVLSDLTLQDLLTQPGLSAGFVPNFLDVKKDSSLPFGVRGRANFSKPGSRSSIQLGVGATPETLFHEASHLAYSKSTMSKAASNPSIGRFISEPKKYAGVQSIMASSIFKNVNQNELFKSLGLNPVQLDFDGKNPGAKYSGAKAVDEITTRIQEKIFKNKGDLTSLSANENAFIKNVEGLGIISNKRMSNVSRRSAEGSKFRSLIEGRFSSVMGGAAGGFVPNFADQVRKNMYDWDGTIIPTIRGGADEYIKQLSSLKEKDLLPIGKKLKAGKKKFDILTSRPPMFEKAISETSSRLGLPVNKINFGIKPKDKLVEAEKRGSKIVDDNLDLIGKKGFLNARVVNKRLSSGFVPNFAAGGKTFNSYASSLGAKTMRIVHPLKPVTNPDGTVSFPVMPGAYGDATVFHREAPFGKDKLTVKDFQKLYLQRKKDPRFWERNSFEYINNASGFIPNFSSALNDAIAREQSSGLSKSQIYVDSHDSLKNKNNPMGLMVANTRDEPKGGIQGIKRAKKEGRNPKTYGSATGFVPNFALNDPGTFTALAGKAFQGEGSEVEKSRKTIEKTLKKFPELGSEFEEVTKRFEGLNSDVDNWIKKIRELNSSASESKTPTGNNRAKADVAQSTGRELVFSRAGSGEEERRSRQAKERRAEAEYKAQRAAEGEGSYQTFAVPWSPAKPSKVEEKKSRFAGLRSAGAKALDYGRQNSMGIGFGLQAAAGMAAEYAGNDDSARGRGMKAAISGVGDIASFAGTGAMIAGPWGALVGGVIGAGKAVMDFQKAISTKVPDLEKALQASADSMNRFGESGQKLLTLNEQYSDALSSGDPVKAADIMAKTQRAYAEELSKLTETQRSSMISAIAQGRGQEEYAKILSEMQGSVRAQESAAQLAKFSESGGPFSAPNKELIKGIDKSLAADFTKGLDASAIIAALDKSAKALSDPNFGTENQALDLMKSLASSESLNTDQKGNLNKIIDAFASSAEKTDLSGVAEAFLKLVKERPKSDEDVKKLEAANRANLEAIAAKAKKEAEIREKTNAMLIKLQSDTEAVYQKYNNSMEDFISSIETASQMMSAAGQYREEYLTQSGANQNIVDPIKEKNIVQKSNADLKVGIYKSQLETSNSFKSGVDDLLSGLQTDSAKLGVGQSATDQSNQLLSIKSTLQQALLPIQGMITSGNYEGAKSETTRILRNLKPEETSAIGIDKVESAIVQLRSGIDQGARSQSLLVKNSQRDLAIQAQQLIFQKANAKLAKAQNFGGTTESILKDTEDSAFNRAIKSVTAARISGYSQEGLQQGKTRAVEGGTAETWGLNGRKPRADVAAQVVDFYKAAGEIGGESVISTDSKDFKTITQALSDQLRKKLDQLSKAGEGVVDPAVFTRLEKNLATLGGGDKVSQLKLMKELGFANISGKKITDEAMKGYSGGAFAGLDPALKKGFEATSDEGASATYLLLADQQKQTDSLNMGLEQITATGLETNNLLSQQPAAIASAIGAILERGRAEQKLTEEGKKAGDLNTEFINTSKKITENSGLIKEAETKKAEALSVLGKAPEGVSTEDFIAQQQSSIDQGELEKARKIVGGGLKERQAQGLEVPQKLLAAFTDSALATSTLIGDWATLGTGLGGFGEANAYYKESAAKNFGQATGSVPIEAMQNQEEFDKAVALMQKAAALDSFKQGSEVVSDKTKQNEALSRTQQETTTKMGESARRVQAAQDELFQRTTQANIAKTQVLPTDGSGGKSYIEGNKAAREQALARNLALQDDTVLTEQQKKNKARSQGRGLGNPSELTFNKFSGKMDTFENTAMLEFGGANREAFNKLISQQVLPSFDKFSKIYEEDAGGKKEGKQAYQETRAELFGREPAPTTKTIPTAPPIVPTPAPAATMPPPTADNKPTNKNIAPPAITPPTVTPPPAAPPVPQQDTSQTISSILSAVQQIAADFQKQKEGGDVQNPSNPATPNGAASGSSVGNISVSTPVSFSVSSTNGEGTDSAKLVADQIKTNLAEFLSSEEFISKVTYIAKTATGERLPPTQANA